MNERGLPETAGQHAALAACLIAVDPAGLGGISVRAAHGPAVDRFLKLLRGLLPKGAPFRRMPVQIGDGRLLGGIDLVATLRTGTPVLEKGLLAEADGGVVTIAMAERVSKTTAARICAVLDSGEVVVEREGFASTHPSRFAVVALDEGIADDERPPQALLDRLAVHIDLDEVKSHEGMEAPFTLSEIERAKTGLTRIAVNDGILRSFCHAAASIGIISIRAPLLAMKTARAHAAICGRAEIAEDDLVIASRLVLAPRATTLPMQEHEKTAEAEDSEQPEQSTPPPDAGQDDAAVSESGEMEDIVLEAARAAIPAGLLAQLQAAATRGRSSTASGRAGELHHAPNRGRPVGTRRGELIGGARLDLVETLRAAAPWQRLRRGDHRASSQVFVRRDDFRLKRFKQRSETATIFVVDASGSAALHRLAEAKGAVELLLADCYVRRDQVALIAFRGKRADLLLPPTRSLARAKRSLSALPGGGGTPLAAAIDEAILLAESFRRRAIAPSIVLLTDARANVARDGTNGREKAAQEALSAARRCRVQNLKTLLVDTSPAPGALAEKLAFEMGGRYLPLPRADAAAIYGVIRDAASVEYSSKAS